MRKFLLVFKEVGICILFVIFALGINVFAFKDIYFSKLDIPRANSYDEINRNLYKVVGDIQNAQNETQTYSASQSQIEDYITDYRYTSGTANPFVSESSGNDLPTETVTTNDNN